MSRRCECRQLMEAILTDGRLRVLPLAAQMVWVRLVAVLARMPEPGVFLVGSRPGSLREVSLLVSDGETDVETQVETLLKAGLLIRRDDGALAVPELGTGHGRAATARKNGSFGGRPRAGETAEQARQRRGQGALLLPLAGGSEAAAETQGNPAESLAGARAAACLEDPSSEKQASKPREETQDLAVLGNELAELARLDPASGVYHFGPIAGWLAAGATPALLRDVLGAIAARPTYQPPRAGFAYFARAVTDAIAARARPAVPPADDAREAVFRKFNEARQRWSDDGKRGPPPNLDAYVTNRAA